ncbi:MAG TPA: carboxypeptidase regulatory-like domain-containing protein [Bryobacteraceae bacterium]|nr:carboxypeptidase regulatory-like domain-containing protein [Bryobacteraceae bacterium]
MDGRVRIHGISTKEKVAPPAYQLRGPVVAPVSGNNTGTSEYDNVVVYLAGDNLPPGQPVKVEIAQRDRHFEPEMVAIPPGSTVSFPNLDPIFHNVFSLSKVKQFDLGYYPQGRTKAVVFEGSGIVQVYCHLHPNMYAAIVVVGSKWYSQPAADGTFHFKNVPAGKYQLIAWHKTSGRYQSALEVPANGSVPVDIELSVHGSMQARK